MTVEPRKAILTAACLALAALVVWAFMLVGSPAHNRALHEDRVQVETASCIACLAQEYACTHENKFPADEQSLEHYIQTQGKNWCSHEGLNCNYQNSIQRPIANFKYSTSAGAYSLCVDMHFDADSQALLQPRDPSFVSFSISPEELKNYKSGTQCITFKVRNCLGKKIGE